MQKNTAANQRKKSASQRKRLNNQNPAHTSGVLVATVRYLTACLKAAE